MKKTIKTMLVLFAVLILCACTNSNDDICGRWMDSQTGQVYEYTPNGYFFEYTNENFTYDKTRYKADGSKITYYIEDSPESEFSVDYEIKDDKLIVSGEIEYIRLSDKSQYEEQK